MGFDTKDIAQIDEWIRRGEGTTAAAHLEAVELSSVAENARAAFAQLALRVGRPDLGVRLLNPIVRGRGRSQGKAGPEERVAYGGCLIRMGGVFEGAALLEKEDADRHPRILLYLFFAAATQWNYREGIELLRRYLRGPDLPPYERRVAQANLAAALVAEREHFEATLLLDELSDAARAPGYEFLLGAVTDYRACNYLLQRRYADARRCLDAADALFAKTSTLDAFFNRKWRAILALCETQNVDGLALIREEAARRKHWETLRDCDRYQAIVLKDAALFERVYYGTPYPSFRDWLERDFGGTPDFARPYGLELAGVGGPDLPFLIEKKPALPSLLRNLFLALSADAYRPLRVTPLHHQLYPDEFYNPASSPHRVHEAVNRARKWLAQYAIPIEIVEEAGAYRLRADKPCKLLLPALHAPRAKETELPDFAKVMGVAEFSSKEFAARAKFSDRTAQRWLEKGVKVGALTKEGSAKKTRYRLKAG